MFYKRHLIMFAPDTGAGDSGAAPAGGAAGTDPANDPGTTTPPATPPAGPTADEIKADFLKGLGFDNAEDLQAVIKAQQDADAANHTDLENAKTNLDKATGKLSKESARADNAEAQLAAYKQGVSADYVDDALALARVDLANKREGVKTIEDALKGVLTRNPAFKGGEATTNPDGTAVDDGNATGGGTTEKNDILAQVKELNKFRIIH
jgi:uncharacterized membrane protein YdfJ with MMPL/SSD domain